MVQYPSSEPVGIGGGCGCGGGTSTARISLLPATATCPCEQCLQKGLQNMENTLTCKYHNWY